METRECYRGTQSDLNTHAKALPRLLGGCYFKEGKYLETSKLVDQGPFVQVKSEVNPKSYPEPVLSREEAAYEVIKYHEILSEINPHGKESFDLGMRAALTQMLTGLVCTNLDMNSHLALRYVRDRVSVPGDMSIWAAKRFRQACEDTASLVEPKQNEDVQIIVEQRSRGD